MSSSGGNVYRIREAVAATLHQVAGLAAGSTFAMTHLLPVQLIDTEDRPLGEMSGQGARHTGTPFLSFFAPGEILSLARECGFRAAAGGCHPSGCPTK